MKQTPRKKITSILLSLTLMLSMVALPAMGTTVQAADAKIQTGLQNIVIGTGNNTTPTVIGFGGKQWVVIGYNDTGVNSDTDTMTLLLSKNSPTKFGLSQYDPSGSSNVYSGSTLQTAMSSAAGTLLSAEQALIVPVDLEGGSTNGMGIINDDKMAGVSVADQLFWPLSVSEANDVNGEVRRFTDSWWLRSAGDFDNYAAVVWGDGFVISDGDFVLDFDGVRPAFKINLTSVIFSSSAAGGKPTQVGANLSAATQPTAEQKLTVIDPITTNLNLTITDQSARTALQGETIGIDYTDAVADSGVTKFVSCVITDSSDNVLYYAKLTSTENGTARINIPANMTAGSYKIKMFNEQCNGDNYTDFASTPKVIDLTVQAPTSPTINGSATGTTTRTVTTGYAASEQIDFTVAGTPAPSFAVTSDGGTGATLAGNRLNISTGLAANTYTITLAAINSQGRATHTVTFTVSDVISYNITITLGASGSGTVTGGGSYDENTSATVTATPNTGWHFKQWTEGGTVVSTGASYSFVVTGNRSLVAEFEADTVPPVPPTPPIVTSSGRSSGSGGTSKADVAPVAGRAFTKADATSLFNAALAAKPEGGTTLSIKARNYTSVDKSVLAELTALAEKNGVTLTVHFDRVVGGKVTIRISVNPATVTTNLDLTVKIAGGKITMPKLAIPTKVAVKMPAGMTIETLKITQSGKDITATAKPWLDANGYLHFSSTGGEIVLANK